MLDTLRTVRSFLEGWQRRLEDRDRRLGKQRVKPTLTVLHDATPEAEAVDRERVRQLAIERARRRKQMRGGS
jgi:hypothetical protein